MLASLTNEVINLHSLGLGLGTFTWDVDPVALKIGPLSFRYYGILFAAALMSGYYILRKQYALEGEDPDSAVKLTYALIGGVIIGARLGHVFFYGAESYLQHPAEIIKFWKGGLASHGATIGLFAVVGFYVYVIRKIPFRVLSDRLVLGIPLATSAVRLGNFFNSEIVGRITDVSWAVIFIEYKPDNFPRHPSQLYEVGMGLTLLAILFGIERYYRKREVDRPLGLLTSVFLVGYFSMRFIVEYFKEYQTLEAGGLTMGQYLSIPFALMGVIGIWMTLAGPWKGQTARAALALAEEKKGQATVNKVLEKNEKKSASKSIEKKETLSLAKSKRRGRKK